MDPNYIAFVQSLNDEELENFRQKEELFVHAVARSKFLAEQVALRRLQKLQKESQLLKEPKTKKGETP